MYNTCNACGKQDETVIVFEGNADDSGYTENESICGECTDRVEAARNRNEYGVVVMAL